MSISHLESAVRENAYSLLELHSTLIQKYKELEGDKNDLETKYRALQTDYDKLKASYNKDRCAKCENKLYREGTNEGLYEYGFCDKCGENVCKECWNNLKQEYCCINSDSDSDSDSDSNPENEND